MDTKTADSHAHHPRVEDDYLLRGNGRFVADAAEPGQTAAAFVRSPHAHAPVSYTHLTLPTIYSV